MSLFGEDEGVGKKTPREEVLEEPVDGSHTARYMGRVGTPNFALVARLSSVFFPLPFS